MQALVTGGGGFLGAWIIRLLRADVIGVRILEPREDRRIARLILGDDAASLDWRIGDVRRADDVAGAAQDCDVIFHLAGVLTPACRADPVLGAEINLIGTLNVFEAAKRVGIPRVLYTSSGGVYGPDDPDTPFPTTLYGAFKLATEGCARAYATDDGIHSIGFRPFVIYGPGRESELTAGPSLACRAAAHGEDYVIPYSGRSGLVYVEDVAAEFVAGMTRPFTGAHIVNQCGVATDMQDVAAMVMALAPGARISVSGPPQPSLAFATGREAASLLGPIAQTSVSAGLKRTIDFYRGQSGP